MAQTQIINDYVTYLEERAYEDALDISLPDSVMIDALDIPEEGEEAPVPAGAVAPPEVPLSVDPSSIMEVETATDSTEESSEEAAPAEETSEGSEAPSGRPASRR